MKRRKMLVSSLSFLLLIAFVLPTIAPARARVAWEVLFNGTVSGVELKSVEDGLMVPVYFRVPADGRVASYGVTLSTDKAKGKIKIERVQKSRPLRDPGDCPKCEGSKDCQDCYPAGSGNNTSGDSCYSCNATGACYFCDGDGICYTCDGDGYEGGCNTCGKVKRH